MNRSFCNSCGGLVPTGREERRRAGRLGRFLGALRLRDFTLRQIGRMAILGELAACYSGHPPKQEGQEEPRRGEAVEGEVSAGRRA